MAGINFHRYLYCLNNPLSHTDPSGMLLEPRINPADAGDFNPFISIDILPGKYLNTALSGIITLFFLLSF